MRFTGGAAGACADRLVSTFLAHTDAKLPPDTRLAFLAMLETALGNGAIAPGFAPHSADLVLDAVMPNIVWRAGRVAGTVRKVGVACLYTLFKSGLADQDCLFRTAPQLLPVLKGSIDDGDANTRHLTCLAMHHLFSALPGALSG